MSCPGEKFPKKGNGYSIRKLWVLSQAVKKFLRHFLQTLTDAGVINYLIKDVLKNPAFNADEVDTDMLKRPQASINSINIQIFSMNVEGDAVLELFKRPVEKVLRKLGQI